MLFLLLNYIVLRALRKIDVHLISTLVNKSLYYKFFQNKPTESICVDQQNQSKQTNKQNVRNIHQHKQTVLSFQCCVLIDQRPIARLK